MDNKPEIYKGEVTESLDSFIDHMDLYLVHVSNEMKFKVAAIFLGRHAFDWFKVTNQIDKINNWHRLEIMLEERFQPVNKVKLAHNMLVTWNHVKSAAHYECESVSAP